MFKFFLKLGFKFLVPAFFIVLAFLSYELIPIVQRNPFLDINSSCAVFCIPWPGYVFMAICAPGLIALWPFGVTVVNDNGTASLLGVIISFLFYLALGIFLDYIFGQARGGQEKKY
jgi:hypothetical protein